MRFSTNLLDCSRLASQCILIFSLIYCYKLLMNKVYAAYLQKISFLKNNRDAELVLIKQLGYKMRIFYFSKYNLYLYILDQKSMGNCLTNKTQHQTSRRNFQKKRSMQRHQSQMIKSSQKQIGPIQSAYFLRKYISLCESENNPMIQEKFRELFSYFNFCEETAKSFYRSFTKEQKISNFETFKKDFLQILKQDAKHLSLRIYGIYFSNLDKGQKSVVKFSEQFKKFIKVKADKSSILEESKQMKQAISQLNILVNKRKDIRDTAQIQKWMKKYMNFDSFKNYLLNEGRQQDQQIAFIMNKQEQGRLMNLKGTTMIISLKWKLKMLEYMESKYKIKKERKQSEQPSGLMHLEAFNNLSNQQIIPGKKIGIKKLETMNDKVIRNSSINQNNSFQYQSMEYNPRQTFSQLEIIRKNPIINGRIQYKIDNYPGSIDNRNLIGNFQWELRKNIRLRKDFQAMSNQTYRQFELAFGGGPHFQRRIIGGYYQLKPYFVRVYQLKKNKQGVKFQFKQENCFEQNSNLSVIINSLPKFIIYHRNIGRPWSMLQPIKEGSDKINDLFTETSFVVIVSEELKQYFIENFLSKQSYERKNRIPIIGDMYRDIQNIKALVCITEQVRNNQVGFVLLNQEQYRFSKSKLQQFLKNYKLYENELINTVTSKKARAGICNLGNTCYMSAALQALFAVRKNNKIFNNNKKFGKQLLDIIEKIQIKKNRVFPIEFKNIFDQKYPFFKGQQQHDVHEFLSQLISVLSQQNPKQIAFQLEGTLVSRHQCTVCHKSTQRNEKTTMLSCPLRDFKKKQIKIDHILNNVKIKTIIFQIEQSALVSEWRKQFQRASKARKYYICEVDNSQVVKSFQQNQSFEQKKYEDLKFQSYSLICAYEYLLHLTKQTLSQRFVYKTKKKSQGQFEVVQIYRTIGSIFPEYQISGTPTGQEQPQKICQISLKGKDLASNQEVIQSSLLPYPYDKNKQMFVQVKNYDRYYNEKIGVPFIFQMRPYYPLASVREAIEACIGRERSYEIKFSYVSNPYQQCFFCGRKTCLSRQGCFIKNQNNYPLQWFEGIAQIIVVWSTYQEYHKHIRREKIDHKKNQINIKEQDDFQISLKNFMTPQQIIMKCDNCKGINTTVIKSDEMTVWPRLLILQLGRFTVKNGVPVKIHTKWKLQKNLVIGSSVYKLKALVLHIGQYADYGHYITVADNFRYDDELVTEFDVMDIPTQEIYLLMYSRNQ